MTHTVMKASRLGSVCLGRSCGLSRAVIKTLVKRGGGIEGKLPAFL